MSSILIPKGKAIDRELEKKILSSDFESDELKEYRKLEGIFDTNFDEMLKMFKGLGRERETEFIRKLDNLLASRNDMILYYGRFSYKLGFSKALEKAGENY